MNRTPLFALLFIAVFSLVSVNQPAIAVQTACVFDGSFEPPVPNDKWTYGSVDPLDGFATREAAGRAASGFSNALLRPTASATNLNDSVVYQPVTIPPGTNYTTLKYKVSITSSAQSSLGEQDYLYIGFTNSIPGSFFNDIAPSLLNSDVGSSSNNTFGYVSKCRTVQISRSSAWRTVFLTFRALANPSNQLGRTEFRVDDVCLSFSDAFPSQACQQ